MKEYAVCTEASWRALSEGRVAWLSFLTMHVLRCPLAQFDVANFIDGQKKKSASTDWIDINSPATQELICRVPRSTQEEVLRLPRIGNPLTIV